MHKLPIILASIALLFAACGFVVNYTIQQSREEVQIVENSKQTFLNSPSPLISHVLTDSPDQILGEQAEQLGQLSVNEATLEELDTVPGVGPKTAEKIINGRPWSDFEECLRLISKRYRDEAREKLKL